MSLTQVREDILAAVGEIAGVNSTTYVPERISPPALIVLPSSPYVEPGDVYGSFLVRHTVSVVMPSGTNEKVTEDMDSLLTTVLNALVAGDISVESVSTFYVYESNGTSYLASDITVTDNVHL